MHRKKIFFIQEKYYWPKETRWKKADFIQKKFFFGSFFYLMNPSISKDDQALRNYIVGSTTSFLTEVNNFISATTFNL